MIKKYFETIIDKIVYDAGKLRVSLVSVRDEDKINGKIHLNLSAKKCNPPSGDSIKISGGEELLREIDLNKNHYQIWIKRESVTRFLECFLDALKQAKWNEFENSDVILSILKNKNLNSLDVKSFTEFLNNQENFGDLKKAIKSLNEVDSSSNQNLNLATNLKILKDNLSKIEYFINNKSSETEIQKWLDEDEYKNIRARCMIFGLEYVGHKREGQTNGNRFDLLTRIGVGDDYNEERILIELKGANADIFETRKNEEKSNNGKVEEFHLSKYLARAIPQILEYRRNLEGKSESGEDQDMRRMGEFGKIKISKCIIVIGVKKDDKRWQANFLELKKSFNSILEIWTYTDLRNKLSSTIKNLEHKEGSELK
jgi:hypothetical protein